MAHLHLHEPDSFGKALCDRALALVAVNQVIGLEVEDVRKSGIDLLEHLW